MVSGGQHPVVMHLDWHYPCLRVLAANDEEVKLLLQKGLTVYEIDQELARIQLEEAHIMKQRTTSELELQQQTARSEETKRHAAKVLRAYYMGDRDSLWMLLFPFRLLKMRLLRLIICK